MAAISLGTSSVRSSERGTSLAQNVGGYVLAFGRGGRGEFADFDSNLFGKGDGGLRGLAVFVSVGEARSEKLLGNVRLRGCDAVSDDGYATRRGEGLHGGAGLVRQTLASDEVSDALLQVGCGGGDHARRDFFGTNL